MAFNTLRLATLAIRRGDVPQAEYEVAMGQAVGVALGLAITLPADSIPMDKIELFNYIAAKHKCYYSIISEANESAMLCVDTAIKACTATWISRLAMSTGRYNGYVRSVLQGTGCISQTVNDAVSEIAEEMRDRAFQAFQP